VNAHVFKPDMPPPVKPSACSHGCANLFSSWLNTLLTLFAFYLIWLIVPPLLQWALIDANWVGTTRADCTKEGACWVFISSASASSCTATTRRNCAGAWT
jgi:general L-amino acid transport system permease protein